MPGAEGRRMADADRNASLGDEQFGADVTAAVVSRAASVADWCAARAADIDEAGIFPKAEFTRIAAYGLLSAPLARELGGLRLVTAGAIGTLLAVLRELGRGNLSVGSL